MPKALITGITGQTGSFLCEQLLQQGWEVHGLVREADDAAPTLIDRAPSARLHSGDLADSECLHRIVAELEPNAVFNLGGISSVADSWDYPDETGQVTGVAAAALLHASWDLKRRTARRVSFVQASSAEIFGVAAEVPQSESTPVRPSSPYGAAKAYAHHMVGLYRERGLEASSCIMYNHESERRPVSFVTRKITRGAAAISLGLQSNLVLGNLDSKRDWGWAPDYARALLLAAVGEAGDYVVATGHAHTVRDFVALSFAAVGIDDWSGMVEQDPAFLRPQDAPELVGDPSKAARVLGWSPSVDLAGLIARMVEFDLAELRAGAAV